MNLSSPAHEIDVRGAESSGFAGPQAGERGEANEQAVFARSGFGGSRLANCSMYFDRDSLPEILLAWWCSSIEPAEGEAWSSVLGDPVL